MNMILKKQITNRRGHTGFTLVEVIVVLVILAILAAIAISALTGYIDKAEDKKYIADARNVAVAMRTVLNELYADGTLKKTLQNLPIDNEYRYDHYINTGTWTPNYVKRFLTGTRLSQYISLQDDGTSDGAITKKKASALMGLTYPPSDSSPGVWDIRFYADATSSDTVFSAPAFCYYCYPNGATSGEPVIVVSYKIDFITKPTSQDTAGNRENLKYNANTGYEVYHFDD
ncbi:MAG: prepilin-type N-terminal cleavage/methylation domain-containing protein [Clostridiales Family XIII bacterium]|jgi:prepilin-type N-terminal cleavage/methylation domain-containing protein|nr:prepilin-type N-terminal cleavage/methylation domain-containing protein [Clostridiales Family XIII bacterium]